MIGYVMLGSNDIVRARLFYDALLPLLGLVNYERWSEPTRVWYKGRQEEPLLAITQPRDGQPATVGNGSMLALTAPSQAVVRAVHAKALELGGRDEGAPGYRGDNPGLDPDDLYRAYFRDLDGNKIAVFAAPSNSD